VGRKFVDTCHRSAIVDCVVTLVVLEGKEESRHRRSSRRRVVRPENLRLVGVEHSPARNRLCVVDDRSPCPFGLLGLHPPCDSRLPGACYLVKVGEELSLRRLQTEPLDGRLVGQPYKQPRGRPILDRLGIGLSRSVARFFEPRKGRPWRSDEAVP